MQNVFMCVGGAALFAVGIAVGSGMQDEKKGGDAKKPAAQQDESLMPAAKLAPEHARLAKDAGMWSFKQKMLDFGSGQWKESTGVETVKMGCGGAWQISDFETTEGVNKGFRGHGVIGYDTFKKMYVGMWADSTATSPMQLTGKYDEAKKQFVMDAVGAQPDGLEFRLKMTTTAADEKHRRFGMSMTDEGGKEVEFMVVEYERK